MDLETCGLGVRLAWCGGSSVGGSATAAAVGGYPEGQVKLGFQPALSLSNWWEARQAAGLREVQTGGKIEYN